MRTPRFLIAAAAAALTVTALAGCTTPIHASGSGDAAPSTSVSHGARPDGRYATPLESRASMSGFAYADWIRLPDGRKVLCVGDSGGGYDCNWDDIRPGDTK